MNRLENIRDVFSIFHDGVIVSWSGNLDELVLTIECQYLAEKINTSFNKFYLKLSDIIDLYFLTWANDIELPSNKLRELKDVFKPELDILSSVLENGKVKIICNQTDSSFDYCGGELFISSKGFDVYDEGMTQLSINQLNEICKSYWSDFSK